MYFVEILFVKKYEDQHDFMQYLYILNIDTKATIYI